MKLTHLLISVFVALASVAMTGCESSVKDVRPGEGPRSLNIGIDDFRAATLELSQQFLAKGVVQGSNGQPPVMAVGVFVNDTTQQVNPDLVLFNVVQALNESGRVRAMTWTDGESLEEPYRQWLLSGRQGPPPPRADYRVTTKLIQLNDQQGRQKMASYVFQMVLTDTRSGLIAWQGSYDFSRVRTRPGLGG